jgi:hypothetical protein
VLRQFVQPFDGLGSRRFDDVDDDRRRRLDDDDRFERSGRRIEHDELGRR